MRFCSIFVALIGLIILVGCERNTDDWLSDLDHEEPYSQKLAAIALLHCPDEDVPRVLGELVQRVPSRSPAVTITVQQTLNGLAPRGIPVLTRLLVQEDPVAVLPGSLEPLARKQVEDLLVAQGKASVESLAAALHDPESHHKKNAVAALARLGPAALPLFIDHVRQTDQSAWPELAPFLRVAFTRAPLAMGPLLLRSSQSTVSEEGLLDPDLADLILDASDDAVLLALVLVAENHPEWKGAVAERLVSVLLQKVADGNEQAITLAPVVFRTLSPLAVKELALPLGGDDPKLSAIAADAMGILVTEAEGAVLVDVLKDGLDSDSPAIRLGTLRALGRIDPVSCQPILEVVAKFVNDDDPRVRAAAKEILTESAPDISD